MQDLSAAMGEPVTLDEIAAEIARAEELLAADIQRDIQSVQSRTAELAATERFEEEEWEARTGGGHSEQRSGVEPEQFDEQAREQLMARIMAARNQRAEEQKESDRQPVRAWEAADTVGAATSSAAASVTARGGASKRPAAAGPTHEGDADLQPGRPARARPGTKAAQQTQRPEPRRRPRTAPRSQRLPGDSAPDRRYRPSRQELERQAREKLDRECTFKPNSSRQRTRKEPALAGMTRQERIDNLAKSKLNLWRKREQQRIENAEKEAQRCTFEPKVTTTKKGSAADKRDGGGDDESVTERLYHEADGRLANRQRLKREKEAAELTRLQFAPTLNSASTASAGAPLWSLSPLSAPLRHVRTAPVFCTTVPVVARLTLQRNVAVHRDGQ
jgi:hypothetical protein